MISFLTKIERIGQSYINQNFKPPLFVGSGRILFSSHITNKVSYFCGLQSISMVDRQDYRKKGYMRQYNIQSFLLLSPSGGPRIKIEITKIFMALTPFLVNE